jgi:hypothetical protein
MTGAQGASSPKVNPILPAVPMRWGETPSSLRLPTAAASPRRRLDGVSPHLHGSIAPRRAFPAPGQRRELSFFCSKKSNFRPDYGFFAPQKRSSGRIADFWLRKTGLPAGGRIFCSKKPALRPDYGFFTPQKRFAGRIADFLLWKIGLPAGGRIFWSSKATYALITHRQSRFLPG